jgi:NADP-dependent 3-hydroxy acid dehydrogenase YdfG
VTQVPLTQQVAVVVGATSDIGRRIALRLATDGAHLCLLGRDRSALEDLATTARGLTNKVVVQPMDLTDEASVREAVAELGRDVGAVDVLVLTAGVFAMGAHERAPIADLDRQYQTNVRGPYLLTQGLLPLLRACRGQVVFVNSTVGLEARAGVGQYASTQHALRAVADALRAEVNPDGVRVLNVYLGRTATARQARIFRQEGRSYVPELLIQPDDVAEIVMATLRLPRTVEVTAIHMRPLVKSY